MKQFRLALGALLTLMFMPSASAASLQPALAGLVFLLGAWNSGTGTVAETAETSKGTSVITSQAGGALLLRQDHTELFDKAGKQNGAFDQLMTIYAESGAVHADYFDGTHIIHYTSATIVPGKSVIFTTPLLLAAPAFRLSYEVKGRVLQVSFAMAAPGQKEFHLIASGSLKKNGTS